MKKINKKGFTLVELVIVIAVIAILAGVLIGTFSGVISRANQSKALQEYKALVDEEYVEFVAENHTLPDYIEITVTNDKATKVEFKKNGNTPATASATVLLTPSKLTTGNVNKCIVLDTTNNIFLVWDQSKEAYVVTTGTSAGANYNNSTITANTNS